MKYTWGVQTCVGAVALRDQLIRIESLGWEVFQVVSAGFETKVTGDPKVREDSVDGQTVKATVYDSQMTPCFAIVVRVQEATK